MTRVNDSDLTQQLFTDFVRTRDPKIRDQIVLMHQNLVRFLAGKFTNRGQALEDLVQVGIIGLINAVDRYDPERGAKFSTYATPTIVGEIRRHFRDKAWSLKVPRRLQELNMAANKAAERLSQRNGGEPTIADIALEIGASEEETLEAIQLGSAYETVSLESQLTSDGESAPLSLLEFLGDYDPSMMTTERYGDLKLAIECLEPRERSIIYLRFFRDVSQTEVAKRLNISQMHVSRLQQKALVHLKELLTGDGNSNKSAEQDEPLSLSDNLLDTLWTIKRLKDRGSQCGFGDIARESVTDRICVYRRVSQLKRLGFVEVQAGRIEIVKTRFYLNHGGPQHFRLGELYLKRLVNYDLNTLEHKAPHRRPLRKKKVVKLTERELALAIVIGAQLRVELGKALDFDIISAEVGIRMAELSSSFANIVRKGVVSRCGLRRQCLYELTPKLRIALREGWSLYNGLGRFAKVKPGRNYQLDNLISHYLEDKSTSSISA